MGRATEDFPATVEGSAQGERQAGGLRASFTAETLRRGGRRRECIGREEGAAARAEGAQRKQRHREGTMRWVWEEHSKDFTATVEGSGARREAGCGIEGVLHRGDAEARRKTRRMHWDGGGSGCESIGGAEEAETSRRHIEVGIGRATVFFLERTNRTNFRAGLT